MSIEAFDENCKGCQPVILDANSGQALPPEHPAVQAVMRAWSALPKTDKQAWHEFTCQNSRSPQIMAVIERIRTSFITEVTKGIQGRASAAGEERSKEIPKER